MTLDGSFATTGSDDCRARPELFEEGFHPRTPPREVIRV
jgi:hypothetical protein